MKWIPTEHYYGDVVRRLFLLASILILVTLPEIQASLSASTMTFIIAVLAFGFLAELTDPLKQGVALFDTMISALALGVFENHAVQEFIRNHSDITFLFLTYEALAIIFFFALYYSVKTIRGMFRSKDNS